MTTIDFLSKPSEELIRKQIKNIKDSYSHPWDLLAELLQNAVDAVRRYKMAFPDSKKEHSIEIRIDNVSKSIEIKDSGIGFPTDTDKAKLLLSPHGTDKETPLEIGQKGIGLKFAIFSCDKFTLESRSVKGKIHGTITGALTWVDRGVGEVPKFEIIEIGQEKHEPDDTSTRVMLEKVYGPDADQILDIKTNELILLLRTKTAVGNTKTMFDQPFVPIRIALTHRNSKGEQNFMEVPFKYQTPTELISDRDLIDLDSFVKDAASMDDRQKAKKLQSKTLYKTGQSMRSGRDLRYFACFVPSRSTWTDISKKLDPRIGVSDSSEDNDSEETQDLMGGGILLATRGMPTGISLVPPPSGAAGYWPNTFILIEDDSLSFDVGRKSVPGRTQGILKGLAKNVFNEFVKYRQYISGGSEVRAAPSAIYEQEKRNTFMQLERLTNLGLSSIKYSKYPDNQEAAVVAIFHELVGAGILLGYYGLKQGYKSTYDFWGKYKIELERIGSKTRRKLVGPVDIDVVIEFKHDGEDILSDVMFNRKFFEDIDLLVCWDLDQAKFARENVTVRVISPDEVFFYGSNYVLEWPGAYNLGTHGTKPVLALKKFIEDLVAKQ